MTQEHSGHNTSLADPRITLPLCFIIFFSVLNGTMFNVAIPDIKAQFGLLPSEVSWVMTAYIVVFALGSLVFGKLADLFSVRNLITTGLILLNAGSLAGLLSVNYPMLIGSRILQASGGSAIPALAMMVATRYVPGEIKGRVLGAIASTVAFAAGIGPIVGGFISGAWHWRFLFIFTLITLSAIPFLRRMLPAEEKKDGVFDKLGAVLAAGGLISLLLFVTQGAWWYLPLGLLLLAFFAVHIRRAPVPFISPELFLNAPYRNTVITTFLVVGTMFGTMFMAPIMLRDLNALSSAKIGLVMFPGAMSAAIMGTIGGRLADRRGAGFVLKVGMLLLVTGHFAVSSIAGINPVFVAAALIISYVGFSFLQSSLPHTVSSALPGKHTGVGMGIYTLFFFVSGAFSAAVIGRILDIREAGFCINPLHLCEGRSWVYSNIFMMLMGMVGAGWLIYMWTFRRSAKSEN